MGKYNNTQAGPAYSCWLVTQDDDEAQNPLPKAVRCDTDGTITFRALGSGEDVTMNVAAGEILSIQMAFIRDTGTTVTAIHGFG